MGVFKDVFDSRVYFFKTQHCEYSGIFPWAIISIFIGRVDFLSSPPIYRSSIQNFFARILFSYLDIFLFHRGSVKKAIFEGYFSGRKRIW
jgi:hypothetical protein